MALHKISKGLDLPLAGEPVQRVEPGPAVSRVALLADDYPGIKPSFLVQPGESVRRGQALFRDKGNPSVACTAPASGRVAAVNRGERRAFRSIVIEIEPDDDPEAQAPFASWTGAAPGALDAAAVRALLLESGLWTALRARPFGRVPAPDTAPRSLFVTAIDTNPHAPDVGVALRGREDDLLLGLACVAKLAPGATRLCTTPALEALLGKCDGVAVETFAGPHPAGTVGLHIHLLDPVGVGRTAWHLGYQDAAAIGHLFRNGRLDVRRIVSLAGPSVARPRLIQTRLGASTDQLAAGELKPGAHRVVSGSVLSGRTAMGDAEGYLGRYHLQVSALAEGRERELFGWIAPGGEKYSVWGVVAGAFARGRKFAFTTTTNGGARAMVPIGSFERVMPMDLMPTFLLRALTVGDLEQAVELGALELDEEDLALCTYVCPGKSEYGPILRRVLDRIEKEL